MFYVPTTPLLFQPVVPATNAVVIPYTMTYPKAPVNTVQHVIHHHVRHHTTEYEETPPQKIEYHHYHHRSPSPPPPPPVKKSPSIDFDLDARLERVRRELRDQSTETVDYYHPPPRPPSPITYKQHYDPIPMVRSRSRSRPRSASPARPPSLPREPWRSTNQNDYPWRDAHLPAYRQATLERNQPAQKRVWKAPVDQHVFYSDVPSYSPNDCIHIVPHGGTTKLETPYLKVIDAPVTYLH